MKEVIPDQQQAINMAFLQGNYYFYIRKLFLYNEILDQLYACNFKKLFEAFTIYGEKNPSYPVTFFEKCCKEFAYVGITKCFYLFIYIYRNNKQGEISALSQGEHLESLVKFLMSGLATKKGYVTQILIMTEDLLKSLPAVSRITNI